MKFLLDLNVGGNARQVLTEVANKLMGVDTATGKINESAGKSAEAWGVVKTRVMDTSESVKGFANKVDEALGSLVDRTAELSKQVFRDAATYEDLGSDLKFAFGDRAESYFAAAEAEAAKLTFSMADVVKVITALNKQKVDIFGSDLENIKTYQSKTGQQITALEVIQDAADAAGRSADRMLFSFREAFSGDWVSMKDALDLSKKDVEEFKKAMAKGNTETEKADILLGKIAARWGGAGALRSENFNKTAMQIPDLLQQINAQAGKPGLKLITTALKGFVDALTELKSNKAAMMALQGFFHVIGAVAGAIIRAATGVVRFATGVLSVVPAVGPLAAGLLLGVVALGGFGLATLTATGAAIALASAILTVEAELLALGAVVGVVFGGAIIAGTAILSALGLVAYATAQVFKANYGGVADTFERIKLVMTAVAELYQTYNGTAATMTRGTADALQKNGLLEVVQKIFMTFHRLNVMFRAFGTEMEAFGARLAPVIIPMVNEMKSLFFELAAALGFNVRAMDQSSTSTESWAQTGRELATALVGVTREIVGMVRYTVHMARMAVYYGELLNYTLDLADSSGTLRTILAGAFQVAIFPVRLLWGLLKGVLSVIGAITEQAAIFRLMWDSGMSYDEATLRVWALRPQQAPEAPRMGVSYDPQKRVKASENDTGETPWAAGNVYQGRTISQEEADALNRGKDIGTHVPGGRDFQQVYQEDAAAKYAKESAGMSHGPPTADAAAAAEAMKEQAAAAQKQADAAVETKGVLAQIQDALSNFSVNVEIDGEAVARAVNRAKEAP